MHVLSKYKLFIVRATSVDAALKATRPNSKRSGDDPDTHVYESRESAPNSNNHSDRQRGTQHPPHSPPLFDDSPRLLVVKQQRPPYRSNNSSAPKVRSYVKLSEAVRIGL